MSIKIYFGVPGSGKTTLAAKLVHDNLKKGIKTYSNVPIKGALLFDTDDIGRIDISDGCMCLDEAGIVFNNRKFKSLPQQTIEWLKLHRHYGIREIYVFSQSYDDMDITLRRLADEIYVVKRSVIPCLFSTKRIKVRVGIDNETHQITDQYFFQFLGIKTYLGYHYWHMFDSWSAPILPNIDWHYSSFDTYTIDKKHTKLIYKKLHREGKLTYKFIQFVKTLFTRKNTYKKEREKMQFFTLSRLLKYLKFLISKTSARASSGGLMPRRKIEKANKMQLDIASSKEVDEAFMTFFLDSPAQKAQEEEEDFQEKKRKTLAFLRQLAQNE